MSSFSSISQLHDERTFYMRFLQDLERCANEVIIESPFITSDRMRIFDNVFIRLLKRGVKIYIVTRDPNEHEHGFDRQAEAEIRQCEVLGIQVLLCIGNHHRKLAILDRKILWEGSLNILSQTHSREIMRRIDGQETALEMFEFLKFSRFL
jgi:phosphatidylserine/phosphatidylglycerophosphate/cardiolipin synthase-like enzyme